MSKTKIIIDNKKCVSCGRCTEICPKVFQMTPKGKIKIIGDDIECAHEASNNCPTHAISVAE